MIKKISAIALTLAMMFMISTAMVSAEATPKLALSIEGDVYLDDVFEVSLVVSQLDTFAGASVIFTYDPEVLQIVDEAGDAITTDDGFDALTQEAPAYTSEMTVLVNNTIGQFEYDQFPNPSHREWDRTNPYYKNITIPYTIAKFRFKAIADGAMELALTKTDVWTTATNKVSATDATIANSVLVEPVFPTAGTPGADTDAPVEGGTVTPVYEWHNGNRGTGAVTDNNDGSVITWYAGTDELATTTAKEAYTVPAEAVGKVLSYTILPKVSPTRPIKPEGTLSEKVTVGMVKAIASYNPSVRRVTLPAELDPTVAVEPTVELDNTYALAEDVSTYEWHVVEADSAEAAIAAISGENFVAEGKAYAPRATDRDKYAVVVVTPVVTVAGDTREGEVTSDCKAAAKITAEDPEINVSAIDVNATLRIKKKVSAAAATIDAKLPAGAVGVEEAVTTYTWYALAEYGAELTEEAQVGGNSAELLLTDEMKDKFIVLTIDYTNVLGYDAEQAVVEFVNAVKKASTNAPAVKDTPSLGGSGTVVTPPTEEPGEEPGTEPGEQPGDEPTVEPNEDPSGNAIANGAAAFADVDKEAYAWAYEGIDTLAKAGVIKGMTETTFGPELTATNAQMIALAVRIAGLTAENATTEKVDAEHWVADEAAVADAKGILGVYGDKVEVEEAVSREVAFTLLYNALKAAGVELPEVAEAIEFTDAASIDANCVEAIDALVKAGIVDGMGDGTLAPKATLTRAQLAKILGLADALITK